MPEDAVTAPNGTADGRPRGPSLTSILRFKWTILTVFALIAAPVIAAVWILIRPEYTARAEVRVGQRTHGPLGDSKPITGHRRVMNTQVTIIRSPTVLWRVLDQTDVKQTSWYRDPPRRLWPRNKSRMERLRDALSVRPRANTEIIGVSFASLRPREAALILNATLDQYKELISERSDKTRDNTYRRLTDLSKSLEEK
ncbi:MAG: Wzz/FepE/Etk N-terminal domain-containing protein, partial [Planctomycetota bacterium]